LSVQVERLDLVARRHHVVDADRARSNRLASIARCLPRKKWPSSTRLRTSSCDSRLDLLARIEPQQFEQPLHEQVDEPYDRIRQAQHRRQQKAHRWGDAIGVRGAHDLGRDLGKDQDRERDGDAADHQRYLALSEQARGDHRGERGRDRVDQRVAEEDDAEQLVGAGEQAEGDFGAAFAVLRPEPQPVPVDRHHRRLGDREKTRNRKQRNQRDDQRRQRNVVQAARAVK